MIRPYKGLPDAIAAVLAVDGRAPARRRRPAHPARRSSARAAATASSGGSATSARAELEQALAEATVAVFPYRDELDQSGALLQALGAGVPAVVYDVGGLGEVVDRFGAGRVVPAGRRRGPQPTRSARCSTDPDELAAARDGRGARAGDADLGRGGRRRTSTLYRELA